MNQLQRVVGYRVLRTLARDDRAEILLVHGGGDGGAATGGIVAKVFGPGVPRAEIDQELAVLGRAAHPHVQAIVDLGSLPDGGVAAIFPRCERGSLGDLLLRRTEIAAGEAITILAPLCDVVDNLHSVGVAHGRIAVSRVLFTAAGAPILIGFSKAVVFAAGAPEVVRLRVAEVTADRDALAALADAVLTRVVGAEAARALAVLDRMNAVTPAQRAVTLRDALFSMATAGPVRLDPDQSADRGAAVAPTVSTSLSDAETEVRLAQTRRRRARSGVAARLIEVVEKPGVRSRLGGLAVRRWTSLSPRVRRTLTAAGAGAGIAAIALIAIPPAPTSAAHGAALSAVDGAAVATATARGPVQSPMPAVPSSGSWGTASSATASSTAAVTGTDPVAATLVLLRARERCIRELSVSCLAAVDEPHSSAAASDRTTISDVRAGRTPSAFITASSVTPVLGQTLGGAALIALGASVSPSALLVTRTANGWRIRDYAASPSG